MREICRRVAEMAAVCTLAWCAQADVSAAWNLDADGVWSAPGNWEGGVAPTGTTGVAAFGKVITANRTVTLDASPWTVNALAFANTGAFGWTLTGGTLFLGGTSPSVTVQPGGSANVASTLSGSAGLTKAGDGALALTGANTFSGDLVRLAGELRVGDGSNATASAGRGTLVAGNGSPVLLNFSGPATLANASVTSSGSMIRNVGPGAVTLTNGAMACTVDGGSAGIVLAKLLSEQFTVRGDVTFGSDTGSYVAAPGAPGATMRIVNKGAFWWVGSPQPVSAPTIDIADGVTVSLKAGQEAGPLYYNNLTGPGCFTFNGADANQIGHILGSCSLGGTLTALRPVSFGNGGTGGFPGGTRVVSSANGPVRFNSTTDMTYSGEISGAGALVKTNANTLTLTGVNTYTGPTGIGGGTLAVGGMGTLGGGAYAGDILNHGAFVYAGGAAQVLSGDISGTGSLTQAGAGTLTLSGYNTYTGATRVDAGTLTGLTGGACVNSKVVLGDGARLGVEVALPGASWMCAGLTCTGGASGLHIDFRGFPAHSTCAPLQINGELKLAGTLDVTVRGGYWNSVGSYPLLQYTGKGEVSGALRLRGVPEGVSATLVHGRDAKRLDLCVTAVPDRPAPPAETAQVWTEVPYRVPAVPWDDCYGHHRARVELASGADAVALYVPWRRRDDPAGKRLIMVGPGEKPVRNILRRRIDLESAEIVFGPAPEGGVYHLYYLPFPVQPQTGNYNHPYLAPEPKPEEAWLQRNRLEPARPSSSGPTLPRARVAAFEARTAFDSLYPMGVPLTAAEHTALLAATPRPFLLFAEDRTRPIQMRSALPVCWREGEKTRFSGTAQRNEYYVFQVGVYAARQGLEKLSVRFSPLSGPGGARLPAQSLTCLNLDGVDPYGHAFTNLIRVARGEVQPLWIAVDIPRDAVPGEYTGTVRVCPDNAEARNVEIGLTIASGLLEDRGDGDGWRLARLRWINSGLGINEEPTPPYTPLKRKGQRLFCLGRQVRLDAGGLPAAITTAQAPGGILAAPVRWVVETASGPVVFAKPRTKILTESPGRVTWRGDSHAGGLRLECSGSMEFDGHLHYRIALHATERMQVQDIRLEIPFRPEIAEYMMGMGVTGGRMPARHDWKWEGPQDSFWAGHPDGGLHCELRGGSYHGPMLNLYRTPPPPVWHNGGKGGLRVRGDAAESVVSVYSGPREILPAAPACFEFAFLITPVKPLDPARQFTERYYHHTEPATADLAAGIKVINVHHANSLNPFINYPFIANDALKAFVDQWHARGIKVKIYYTLRELTNHLPEIWFLRSLGYEVLADGPGGGYPWLREHLGDHYLPQWYFRFEDGTVCAALANSGETRWYNFYVEGLGWLMRNIGIDGLYLDDVSYDRRTLQRMRRVMAAARPDCRIDLHSNTAFSIGPATQYAEFFPYVDKLWFGESFRYDQMTPDQWLVQASGIPFGLMSDMLQDGGNPWLGMVYGMTARLPWSNTNLKNPRTVWKVWDDFGIADARMSGYWDSRCPVQTGHAEILATAYVRPGKALLAIGSWAKQETGIRLAINWKALGIRPDRATFHAPPVDQFQEERRWKPDDTIPVKPLRGWLIIVTER